MVEELVMFNTIRLLPLLQELTGVQSKECSEDLLPTLKQSETQPTNTGKWTSISQLYDCVLVCQ